MPPIRYATARDGTRIAWARFPGESPPWLQIYSPGGPPMSWTPSYRYRVSLIEEFAASRATILFDFRGTGHSEPISGALTAEDLAQDIAAACEAVDEPMDVMMMNSGCFPGLLHALDCHNWRKVLLTLPYRYIKDSFSTFNESLFSVQEGKYYWEFCRHVLLMYMGATAEQADALADDYVRRVPLKTYVAYVRAFETADLAAVLPHVKQDVYVSAVANEDGRRHAEEVASLNPRAVLLPLPYRYHGPDAYRRWRELLGGHPGNEGAVPGAGLLSRRESEVLRLLAHGRTNAQVAAELVITEATVARHVHNILVKLDCANRAEAAAWAAKNGLA